MTEAEQRAAVVAAARGWRGTPYHHRARVKGAGVDCAQILVAAYSEAGVIEAFDTGDYPQDWMLHRSEERYVEIVERFATEFDWRASSLQPGDVVVWRYGRTFSHGGIVTEWPRVIHAFAPFGCVDETDASLPSDLTLQNDGTPRPMRAFTFWRP